jgi:hypothetical protein
MLTRKQDAVAIEALGWAKGEGDRACPPRLDPVEQCRRGGVFDLVFSAEGDVRGNKRGLDWVK